ncbi:hypothetical protein QQS21_010608 [Conoideocrella luteorostrata]|uniref:Peptidase S8/S53 domain-containing protein n=1 Tax=Conoideocrella luteorostrata TaxID=1105319 RepID=A0AAJ0CJ51_9HYPO|nr:hypothetical protein QQS21_010608 [Conoideocrella luteorostrata]
MALSTRLEGRAAPKKWNVVLKKQKNLDYIISRGEIKPDAVFSRAFIGFSALFTADQREMMGDIYSFNFMEQDISEASPPTSRQPEEVSKLSRPWGKKNTKHGSPPTSQMGNTVTQKNAPWGLARISNRIPHHSNYAYDKSAGTGTCVYVLDTGIEVSHTEFQGRAKFLKNFVGGDNDDTDGRGTHVAGIIGSATYGVAKNTALYSIKVQDKGITKASTMIEAIEFLLTERLNSDECPKGSVIHISVPIDDSEVLAVAVAEAVRSGFVVVIAAGNDGAELHDWLKGYRNNACRVGAIDREDVFASYSNHGERVNILAPGTNITSTWTGHSTGIVSGAEMASAHVAGLSAYLLGLGYDARNICKSMASMATRDRVDVKSFPSYKMARGHPGWGNQNKKLSEKEKKKQEQKERAIYHKGKQLYSRWDPPNKIAYNGVKK